MASLTDSTLKQYDAPIREWYFFCQEKKYSVFEASQNELLEFLTKKFDEGASYSTLNTARSAVSLILSLDVSQCPIITRFFKGVYKLRPSKPRYSKIWNTEPVLKRASELYPLSDLALEQLTNRLIILLALGTAHRVQTLSLINIDEIKALDTGVDIRISKPIKTSRYGAAQPNFFIPFFNDKPKFCLASTIIHYVEVTKVIRKDVKNLILCVKKPHKAATAQTISRWIRAFLRTSGINGEYSGQSTRHASTSAALKKGLDVSIIKSTAGWSRDSLVFARFYNRPIESDRGSYVTTVLS